MRCLGLVRGKRRRCMNKAKWYGFCRLHRIQLLTAIVTMVTSLGSLLTIITVLSDRPSPREELEYELRINGDLTPLEGYLELRPHTPVISERALQLANEIGKTQDSYSQALCAIAHGDNALAESLLSEAATKPRENLARIMAARGRVAIYAGRPIAAPGYFREALSLMPGDMNLKTEAATAFFLAGQYNDAAFLLRPLASFAEANVDSQIDCLDFFASFALIEIALARYQSAEGLLSNARRCQSKIPVNVSQRATLDHIGGLLLMKTGNYAASQRLLEAAIAHRSGLEPDDPRFIETETALGRVLIATAQYQEASRVLQRAHSSLSHSSHATIERSQNLWSVAWLYEQMAEYSRSETLLSEAIEILENDLGRDHPEIGGLYDLLGQTYWSLGRYAEAEAAAGRARSIARESLGANHPSYAAALVNLGAIYWSMARFEEAEKLTAEGVEILRRALGPNHPRLAEPISNLATLFWSRSDLDRAEQQFRQSLDILYAAVGPTHDNTGNMHNNLGSLYWSQKRYAEAEREFKKAFEINRIVFGSRSHPDIARTESNRGVLRKDQGLFGESLPFFRRAIEIYSRFFGERGHEHIAVARNNLGEALLHLGRYEEAEEEIEESLIIAESRLGKAHPNVATVLETYARLLRALGQNAEAAVMEERAKRIRAAT